MNRFLLFIFLSWPAVLPAQFTYVFDQNVPVTDIDGTALSMPWAGGLNATQYNTMDLNADGKDDLVLFDRMANKVITILNRDGGYQYAPEYEIFFPEGITNWLLLRDFNCDGKKDIFTGDVLGIKVYQNITTDNENPAFEQFLFFSGFAGPKSQVLLTKGFSNKVNLQIQFDDLPAIADADGDGDLDIFNFRFVGNGTVEFHKNFSMERYGSCDSLDFERITQTWGNFKECTCGVMALNGQDCTSSGRTKHAGGKSLLAMDLDGDQDLDLVMSEAECAQLYQLINEGTLLNPVINSYEPFPPSRPVNIVVYPSAYHEDVDFDGKKDLVFSTNAFAKQYLSSNFEQSNLFYKNTGTPTTPAFTFIKQDFLQEHMVDVGDNAVPAFADYDGDGDYDMFISRNSSGGLQSTILLYENTGTENTPAFTLINGDYLSFSQSEFYNLKIQFVDMDANNTIDIAFTATNLFNGITDVYMIPNKSQNTFNFSGQSIQNLDFTLTSNENLYFTDINGDGKTDILAGRGNGSVQYWKNSGPPSRFQFTLDNETFLGLNSSVLRQNITFSVADLDADGNADLIFGDQSGKVNIVSDYRNATDASVAATEVVFNSIKGAYAEQNLGGRIWPTVVNLFNTTKPAIVSGNVLGGVTILKHDEGKSLPGNPAIEIFPNPVDRAEVLNLKIDRPAFFQVLSLLGQTLSEPVRLQAHQTYKYKLQMLASGIYLIKFTVGDKHYTRRIVVY